MKRGKSIKNSDSNDNDDEMHNIQFQPDQENSVSNGSEDDGHVETIIEAEENEEETPGNKHFRFKNNLRITLKSRLNGSNS